MSEQVTIPKSQEETASGETQPRISQPIVELLQEIMQTPREYWPNLLKTIRLFRETVSELPKAPTAPVESVDITKLSKEERIKRNQGAIDLINSWVEEGDEQEQTETAEFLLKALDEDRLSNRPLFPKE